MYIKMCIPTNFEYKSHPLLVAFPNLYDVKCVIIISFMSEMMITNKICINCFEREQPPNFKLLIGHGLIYGPAQPARCIICRTQVTTLTSTILNCDACFCAYVQFMRIFREYYPNEIAHLIMDVDVPGVVLLSIYDPVTGAEIRIDPPFDRQL